MCGIFAYVGNKEAKKLLIEGLTFLEYRGYDSSGIAYVSKKSGEVIVEKACGKVKDLEKRLNDDCASIGIGHTRWATHGCVVEENAHPHCSNDGEYNLVHNGIIENYLSLKQEMPKEKYYSETDSEVLVKAIANQKGSTLEKIFRLYPKLEGSFACVLLSKKQPHTLYAFAKESSLVIGLGDNENFVSSDLHAFMNYTRKVMYLEEGEVAKISMEGIEVFNKEGIKLSKAVEETEQSFQKAEKGHYQHYTLKEIFEQSSTLKSAYKQHFKKSNEYMDFEGAQELDTSKLKAVDRIVLLACGTSWHAALYASYFFTERLGIDAQAHISSEFRYRRQPLNSKTLVIAISQSGETADTLAAIKSLDKNKNYIISMCNILGSSLSRYSQATLYLKAGPEIGVCSTKAFTSQVVVLFLFGLFLEKLRGVKSQHSEEIQALQALPLQVKQILNSSEAIHELAKGYVNDEHFFYLGRHYMFPCALEGALKLKEITYINANAYPAGELKHGPLALISDACPSFAFCCHEASYCKMLNNLKEIKARKGRILAVTFEGDRQIDNLVDKVLYVPKNLDELMIIPATVISQLFAYYVAVEKGLEVDTPRNLAKSVTVE